MAVPKGIQFLGEGTIGDAIDAIGAVRRTRNVRALADGEIRVAREVFKERVPYSRVFVSDGLGLQGREYTTPVPYTSPRKYLLHVGERGYFGMSKFQEDKNTLVHELTHVWQGQHSRWAWSVVFSSGWHQAGGNAYDYDKKNYKDWDDYNPEQQAQIVEDWFKEGKKEDDPRYHFIVWNIRGEIPLDIKSHEEIRVPYRVTQHEQLPPVTDDYLISILEKRYAANDVAGYGGRARKLEQIFGSLDMQKAMPLLVRLELRPSGDKVALYFHNHLSTATRTKLLQILRGRLSKK